MPEPFGLSGVAFVREWFFNAVLTTSLPHSVGDRGMAGKPIQMRNRFAGISKSIACTSPNIAALPSMRREPREETQC